MLPYSIPAWLHNFGTSTQDNPKSSNPRCGLRGTCAQMAPRSMSSEDGSWLPYFLRGGDFVLSLDLGQSTKYTYMEKYTYIHVHWKDTKSVSEFKGAPCTTAGCTILGGVHPVCSRFLSHLLLLYIERVHGTISGCTVLWGKCTLRVHKKKLNFGHWK